MKTLQWVPLPVWLQSAAPTAAKEAEEHEHMWRSTQGDAPPSASLALGWYVSRFQRLNANGMIGLPPAGQNAAGPTGINDGPISRQSVGTHGCASLASAAYHRREAAEALSALKCQRDDRFAASWKKCRGNNGWHGGQEYGFMAKKMCFGRGENGLLGYLMQSG
ncbi:hypothetical protein [Oligosphaera ethanolica]|uniref:Uncharacterized protein n=1 Tax=Oligosphaera ethanolica TaxID=760260 RepID=A0AAE3VHC8_9BACT|nr:hypothetical protein [Oligosphaera ethanolica]MDQ0290431.1 hypothetical protein [Oligosphaera ethanolica]